MDKLLQESWYEKLNRWEEALRAYDAKREETQPGSIAHLEASMGRLRQALFLLPSYYISSTAAYKEVNLSHVTVVLPKGRGVTIQIHTKIFSCATMLYMHRKPSEPYGLILSDVNVASLAKSSRHKQRATLLESKTPCLKHGP